MVSGTSRTSRKGSVPGLGLLRKNLLILVMRFLRGLCAGAGPVACPSGATLLCLERMQPIVMSCSKYVSHSSNAYVSM